MRAFARPGYSGLIARLPLLARCTLAIGRPLRAQTVAEVQVTPETMTLGVGERQTLFATAYDRQGNLIPNATLHLLELGHAGRQGGEGRGGAWG